MAGLLNLMVKRIKERGPKAITNLNAFDYASVVYGIADPVFPFCVRALISHVQEDCCGSDSTFFSFLFVLISMDAVLQSCESERELQPLAIEHCLF